TRLAAAAAVGVVVAERDAGSAAVGAAVGADRDAADDVRRGIFEAALALRALRAALRAVVGVAVDVDAFAAARRQVARASTRRALALHAGLAVAACLAAVAAVLRIVGDVDARAAAD